MKKHLSTRLLSLLLVAVMLVGFAVPVEAAHDHTVTQSIESEELSFEKLENGASLDLLHEAEETEEESLYADTDIVRVSIVLDKESTIEAGFAIENIAADAQAMSYRDTLKTEQETVTANIETAISGELDVQWNLTLAANIISANVEYGQLETIAAVSGVKDVFVEARFEPEVVDQEEELNPNMATSGKQIGSTVAWANGYTGAGSRVAIIDTGLDTDHQSFSSAALNYSLAYQAGQAGVDVEEYIAALNLLDVEEIASVRDQLNVPASFATEDLYINTKAAFGYNYIDKSVDVTHDNDSQGSHGSHVAGIAAANAYIEGDNGVISKAMDTVYVQGVAPDAQIITMKVFGKAGGAYESDYMAAIEDAIVLNCDAINLSMGSTATGFTLNSTYQELLNSLADSGSVATVSAGNNGSWATNAKHGVGYIYADDVSMATGGAPGSYTNSLTVASVDNDGQTGYYVQVGEEKIYYNTYSDSAWSNAPMYTIGGEYEYVFIDGLGTEEDWAAVGEALVGKIAICSRGNTSFFQKAEAAVAAGAVATIIYNNTSGTINMDLSSYTKTQPCVSITQEEGALIRSLSTPVTDEEGNVLYLTGKMTVGGAVGVTQFNDEYYTVSSFSAWGVPGSLILKPEITAPGGNIYSVNGLDKTGKGYVNNSGTSMSAPQVAGMTALVAEYIRDKGLETKTGLTRRQLAISLLMSTAIALVEEETGNYYAVMKQGSGLANVGNAVTASSYILMGEDATAAYADGKVKAELGDDAERKGEYSFTFSVNNFSDAAKTYTLGSDFFTQDTFEYEGNYYLDTKTAPIAADVTYLVDGVEFVPVSKVGCDLDADGDTDADDAQIILNYCAGIITEIDAIADVNGDGNITTYDAYLILDSMETREFTVAAGAKVNVTVQVVLSDNVKAALNEEYVNGAYIEGFVFVNPTADAEGVIGDVTHSIPVLGFYGNWTDASMYDKSSYIERLYGDTTANYLGEDESNVLTVKYDGDSKTYYLTGNPYFDDETYPADRIAINGNTKLNRYEFSLIRNAAALSTYVMNQDGELLYVSAPTTYVYGAFYNSTSAYWVGTSSELNIGRSPNLLKAEENDVLTVGVVAIPEYYAMNGALTIEDVKSLIQNNTLGDGAYLNTKVTVDSTAPELLTLTRSLLKDEMYLTAADNQYIALVSVTDASGNKVYAKVNPEQNGKNETIDLTFDLSEAEVGNECVVTLADYAGNEVSYLVNWSAETKVQDAGEMFIWSQYSARGEGKRWMTFDRETLWWKDENTYTGSEELCQTSYTVLNAEYVEGYVYMACKDGYMYVCKHGDWNNTIQLARWDTVAAKIKDMAINYADGKMYVLDEDATFYTMDFLTGELTRDFTVEFDERNNRNTPHSFTIDDEGNFYAVNNMYTSSSGKLFTWTKADIVTTENEDGTVTRAITDLQAVGKLNGWPAGSMTSSNFNAMAWDHDNDVLYLAKSSDLYSNYRHENELYTINTETAEPTLVNSYYPDGETEGYPSGMGCAIVVMYIVPSATSILPPADRADSVEVTLEYDTALVNSTFSASAEVGPWILKDKSVSWSTSDESIAVIDQNGKITTTGAGTVSIIATSNAEPHVQGSAELTVNAYPSTKLTAGITTTDGKSSISEFNTSDLSVITSISDPTTSYMGGGYHDGKAYYHDGANIYSHDAESMEMANLGVINSMWQWTDATSAPLYEGNFDNLIGVCYGGTIIELINPESGTLSYIDLSARYADNPIVAIALVNEFNTKGGHDFYYLTENGMLYQLSMFAEFNGAINANLKEIGQMDIELPGAGTVGGGSFVSMTYDKETGYLLLAYTMAGIAPALYAINPADGMVSLIGNFPENVSVVSGIYEYDRATELTVRPSVTTVDIFAGETYDIDAKVLPAKYTQGVTWSSSDTAIATVDANGVVTAVSAGTVTITATSMDVNDAGEHATADITVNVGAVAESNIQFHAQVTDATGTYWAKIDTANQTITKEGTSTVTFTGAGVTDGKLYGTDNNYKTEMGKFYTVDPQNGYAVTASQDCSLYYTPLDVAASPYMSDIGQFGIPAVVTMGNQLGFLNGATGEIGTLNIGGYLERSAAVAFGGITTYEYRRRDYPAQLFYSLDKDGDLAATYGYYWTQRGYTRYATSVVGNIGLTFSDYRKVSMTYISNDSYKGLLIADSGSSNLRLYFVDMSSSTMTVSKLKLPAGITNLVGLYTDTDIAAIATEVFVPGTETQASSLMPFSMSLEEQLTAQALDVHSLNETGEENSDITVNANGQSDRNSEIRVNAATATVTDEGVSLKLTETVDVTNGKIVVTYDPAQLTYKDYASAIGNTAVKVDAENGKITFTYATAKAVKAEDVIATINFTYAVDLVETSISAETEERNDQLVDETPVVTKVNIEVGGHNYEVTESVEVTCTTDGYKVYTCTKCGDSYREELKSEGHKYEPVVTAPTCTEMGYTTYTCSVCQDTYTADYVNSTGHNYEAAVTAPTCTEAGYTTYTCACGESYVSDYVAPTGHTFGEWETVTAPGCEAKGQEKRTCECGETEYRDTDPTGHSFGEWTVTKAATCTEKGIETRTCACGKTETRDIDPTGHSYEANVIEPTCTESGYTEHICSVCGDSYITDVVDPTGHDYEAVVTDPTCTEAGYTTYICDCGESYVSDYVPATGHTFGEWTVTTAPTCTEKGEETRYCAGCDAYETREIAPYCPTAGYTDVPVNAWYHDAVDYVVENGIMEGLGDGIFAPNGTTTRAQMVQVLYRLAGKPSVAGLENPFTDVAADAWYADAVIWAVNAGVVEGMSKTVFAPNANISREQLVTILYRFAGETEVDTAVLETYADGTAVSDWAEEAFAWAVANGIITGMSDGTLAPQGTATRAQIATILTRFMEL